MRFKNPNWGENVYRKRFAFFPVTVGDCKLWLEFYYSRHEFYGELFFKERHLPEDPKVQAYLLKDTPLAKALTEEK